MTQKDIRIGIVDANGTASWAKVSHIPAIQSLRDVKLEAVPGQYVRVRLHVADLKDAVVVSQAALGPSRSASSCT